MKKKVIKLTHIPEASFFAIGISSHENDYRLSWAINNALSFQLQRVNNYCIEDPKHQIKKEFAQYEYINEEIYTKHLLIANQSDYGFLIPELSNIDFFMILLDEADQQYINSLISQLKEIDIISMAYQIEISTLKSKRNLSFNE